MPDGGGVQVTQLQKQRANLEARLAESNNKIRMLKADLYAPEQHGYEQCAGTLLLIVLTEELPPIIWRSKWSRGPWAATRLSVKPLKSCSITTC